MALTDSRTQTKALAGSSRAQTRLPSRWMELTKMVVLLLIIIPLLFEVSEAQNNCQNGQKCGDGWGCCSIYGWCGTSGEYCDAGKCASQCDAPRQTPAPGMCQKNEDCKGTGECCSQYGWCGTSAEYCPGSGGGSSGGGPPQEPDPTPAGN